MKRILLGFCLSAVIVFTAAALSEQRVVMRWSHECVHVEQDTYYEAPMSNGRPDLTRGKVYKLLIDESCGVNEVKR